MNDNPRERQTILIVDDSPDTLTMLTDALERSGATVLVAISGHQALALVERITPDLILLDAVMPQIDGFETCRQLKAMPSISGTPIIFMTGLSETEHIVQGLQAGGVDYVTKPLSLDELLARVDVHLVNARVARSAHAALDTVGRHLLATDREGALRWTTPQARELLSLDEGAGDMLEVAALAIAQRNKSESASSKSSSGFITKTGKPVELDFLGEVSPGEFLFRLTLADNVMQSDLLRRRFALTAREAEVLTWIARGKSNRDIGEILGLSPRTVNKHLEQVFAKLGVENRVSAAAIALRSVN